MANALACFLYITVFLDNLTNATQMSDCLLIDRTTEGIIRGISHEQRHISYILFKWYYPNILAKLSFIFLFSFIVHICLFTIISWFAAIGGSTYGIGAFLSYRQWRQTKINVIGSRQDNYTQNLNSQTVSSIIL